MNITNLFTKNNIILIYDVYPLTTQTIQIELITAMNAVSFFRYY